MRSSNQIVVKGARRRAMLALACAGVFLACMLVVAGCASSSSSSSASASASASASSGSSSSTNLEYTVPNVLSLTQADAEKAILASGLRVGNVTREASDTIPQGSVVSQDPKALTNAKANSTVNLVISTGKAEPKDVVVPDLKGKSQADAEKALADQGLVGVAANPEETSEVNPGLVFKQSVAAGSTAKEGTKVVFTVALSPSEVTVPNVVGMSRSDAKAAIEKAGLGFDYTVSYNDKVEKDKVVSQSVAAGGKLKSGMTLSVVVSLGAAPEQDIEVPNVISFTWSDAAAALDSAGLAARYTGDPDGVVTSQDVAAGTKVAPRTLVTVTLTKPVEYVIVPDLVGLSVTAADVVTDEAGLALEVSGGFSGTVISQWPSAGTQVEMHSTVTVNIEQDPEDLWVPVSSAAEAASFAGLKSFEVMDSVYIGNSQYNNPSFSYADGIAQAIYDAPACRVVIRKGTTSNGVLVPGETRTFSQQWNQIHKGLNITCYGDAQDKATYIEWTVDKDIYSAYYEGLGGETMTMAPEDVTSIVSGIQ